MAEQITLANGDNADAQFTIERDPVRADRAWDAGSECYWHPLSERGAKPEMWESEYGDLAWRVG